MNESKLVSRELKCLRLALLMLWPEAGVVVDVVVS